MTREDQESLLRPLRYDEVVERARWLFARDRWSYVFLMVWVLVPLDVMCILADVYGWFPTRSLQFVCVMFSSLPMSYAACMMSLYVVAVYRGERPDFMVSAVKFGKGDAVSTLGLAVALTAFSFELVVPGLVFLVLFAFVAPVTVLEKKRRVEALKRSASLVMGGEWKRLVKLLAVWVGIGAPVHLALLLLADSLHLGMAAGYGAITLFHCLYDPPTLIAISVLYIDARVRREGIRSVDQLR